ncbi:hypothetical protein CJP74_05970 [Psittacicella melopsittaci]|uniref:GTP pyrophosphokinase n=1 Tax=Psittacicella melopsittaci TaxID=2028576 RepID=A0A3A1Y0Y1_9GAMM|nr:RelA/SpoT family protein [Psittacicella melopsittaci]RIY31903.1 hypothetical protein CJP74_05970 [Psittacicella melopsittaci]
MVKVRFSHLQSLDPKNLNSWLDNLHNQKFKERLNQLYDYYCQNLIDNQNLRDEVKLTIFSNSCELVEILDSLNLDDETLLAAFIFPLIANGQIELKELADKITPLMYRILKGTLNMSQIDIINFNSGKNDQINSIRHLLLTMADDYRSIIIKLAERILFLRALDTNKNIENQEKVKIASNIIDVYGSLANRLGIGQLKWEIEDLCLKITNPDAYYAIVKKLGVRRIDRLKMISDFEKTLAQRIRKECGIQHFELYGRPKHIYSIYNKMRKKNLQFEQLYDLFAARVIVDTVSECYAVLSMIQSDYQTVESEFTDYIVNAKPNGYQSIHTIIRLNERFTLELQIRTEQMHRHAEVGVAAHWQYKEGKKSSNKATDKIAWLRKLLEWQNDISSDPKQGEEIRKQLLDDRVYIFTPRGEVRDLPKGATPLDFAYSIHTEVGNHCVGAKVNNRIVNFSYELQTGDKVEILTQKEPNISRDWINFVKTPRAKSKVIAYFAKLDRDKYIKEGLQIIESACNQTKQNLKNITPVLLKRYKLAKNFEELCLNFGNGTLKANNLISFLENYNPAGTDFSKAKEVDEILHERLNEINDKPEQPQNNKGKQNQIIIEGTSSVMYQLARCCQPIPGDQIIGYITKGRGVSVHRADCLHVHHLMQANPGRIVQCSWNRNYKANSQAVRARLQVIGLDRVGMLRDISAVLSSFKATIVSFNSALNQKTMLSTMRFEVDFKDVDTMNKVLISISKISGVVQAIRT